jgi:dTDP-glucose pyrophosphorylase
MIRLKEILIKPNSTIKEAMVALNKSTAEIVLVVNENGKLLATVTDGDIRRGLLNGLKLDDKIEKCMQRNFIFVKEKTGRAEVLDLMKAHTIKQIPILDEEGRVKGLHLLREIIGSYDKPNIALIMAGGKGERLKPITDEIPKPMVKVAGRPILERLILHLISYGIKNFYIAVNYKSEVIENHFLDGRDLGCKINYIKEKKPLGTAGALGLLKAKTKEPIFVLNGDLLTQFNLDEMLNFHKEKGFDSTIGVYDYVYKVPYGVVEEKNGKLLSIKEKPSFVWSVNAGIYILKPDLIKLVPKNENFTMPELFEKAISLKKKIGIFHIEGDWMDVGFHKDLKKARGEI